MRYGPLSSKCNVRFGNGRAPIGTNENEPRLSIDRRTLHTNARVAVDKMASNCDEISSSRPFSFGLWTHLRYLTQLLKQGSDGNPLRLKVCVRSTYEAGWNRRVVQKLQRGVKVSDIHSGFRVARLIWLNVLSFLPGTLSDAWSTCVWINRLCL